MCKIDVKYIYNIAKFYKSNTLPVGPICRFVAQKSLEKNTRREKGEGIDHNSFKCM